MIPQRVRIALLIAFICHGFFILTARYRLSYDAYTHMLFANHYAESWFSLWETRWYTGFTIVSYPPLVHQLIAIFVPFLGFDAAFAFVLWTVTTLYPLGIYAFSRIFIGRSASSYAALASAILLPIYVVAYVFGQLPFLASTLIALFGAASLNRYLREGGVHNLLLTVALVTTTMAAHHATLIVQPFLIFAVVINHLYSDKLHLSLPQRLSFFLRFIIFAVPAAITCIIVIWPFWQWGLHQSIQIPIDHPSRHNFFEDPLANLIFFWPLYGPLVLIIPFLFYRWPLRFLGLITSFIVLFLLGLGGTTSLPRFFFGDAWEWLTYDRFAFWASLTLTTFFGMLFIHLKHKWRNKFKSKPIPGSRQRNIFSAITFSVFTVTALGAWLTPLLFPTQPEPIDMKPIVDFLNRGDHSQWRYLTFGFGDQFAYLNLLTKATTIDGSYHTARTLPELRNSGIGQVDTVYWAPKGIPAIIPILQKSGDHGVRWGFVNPETVETIHLRWGVIHRNGFVEVLEKLGWIRLKTLKNGILVYENPKAQLPAVSQPPITKPITSFSWGVLPILSFVTTISLGMLRLWPVPAEKALQGVYAFLVALIPLSLCFWYYRTIAEFPHDRVYFTYTSALFFLSDGLALFAVLLWIATRIAQFPQLSLAKNNLRWPSSDFVFPLFALLLFSSLSSLWSTDWRISVYITMQLWLIFLLVLSLRSWENAWNPIIYGFCAALTFLVITGTVGFVAQSTAFLEPLHMSWPGVLDPATSGGSVVAVPDGPRILRAYGTLPHPNILGGFVLVSLLGPASLFLVNKRPIFPALILYSFGIVLIGLTFSRSAWLGLLTFIILLILKSKYFERKHVFYIVAIGLLTIVLTLYSMRDVVFTRISNAPVETEQRSTLGRSQLNQQALEMIRQHPGTGVGIGSFILELARRAHQGASIEPVHNIFLLAGAELGIFGLILIVVLFVSIGLSIIKTQTPKFILTSAMLAGVGIISFFDHYFWTLAPGRLMLGLALGIWAGSMSERGA